MRIPLSVGTRLKQQARDVHEQMKVQRNNGKPMGGWRHISGSWRCCEMLMNKVAKTETIANEDVWHAFIVDIRNQKQENPRVTIWCSWQSGCLEDRGALDENLRLRNEATPRAALIAHRYAQNAQCIAMTNAKLWQAPCSWTWLIYRFCSLWNFYCMNSMENYVFLARRKLSVNLHQPSRPKSAIFLEWIATSQNCPLPACYTDSIRFFKIL